MRTWFNNLKVSHKLMLISLLFIMPDSMMLYMVITGINEKIRFACWELKGNEYQRPLEELLEHLPQHRFLAERLLNAEGGTRSPELETALALKQAELDRAFARLEAVDARIGRDLQFTDEGLAKRKREHYRARIVKIEWEELKKQVPRLDSNTCAERHLHLIADVRTMITHAGDLSNLILDPDLDTYYLMDVTLLALPQTQDRLAAVMAYGESALRRQALSNADRVQLSIDASLLRESDLERVVNSTQTALNEDPNFYGTSATFQTRVPPLLQEYKATTETFITLTRRLADSETINVSAEEYLQAGTRACEASFKLWRASAEELDTMLQKRIDDYRHTKTLSLRLTALALVAAALLVTFITRSISGPLRRQAEALKKANQALQGEIAEREQAEAHLRKSQQQLATAQHIAHIGSWEWDVLANTMTWSDENYRIYGLQPQEVPISHETGLQFAHPQDRAALADVVQRSRQDGKPFSFEHRIIRRDQTERFIQQLGEAIFGPQGAVIKMVGTVQDVTEKKRAEVELEAAHKKLLETSRRAGMAEVATGVLHNVGNVLNSVNVTATLVGDHLRKSRIADLAKLADLLDQHKADLGSFFTTDARGAKVPTLVRQLAEKLTAEQTGNLKELESLQKNIAHIKDIVAMQQSYAKVSGITEIVSVTELVEDTLRMNAASLARHDLQVFREYAPVPPITIDKHKVLQILVNLVRNAKNACDESGRTDKRLTVRIANGDHRLRISVIDNGVGIPPENLTRIFNHGFTTKKDGHGFGLHSGALAAKEMGGSLTAQSDGAGQGAVFTLELPCQTTANS